MKMFMGRNDDTHQTPESNGTNRRTLLKFGGTSIGGAAGLSATAGSATAQLFSSGIEEFELDGLGAADELPSSDESELVIYLHGGGASSSAGDQGQSLEDGLANAGYETTVVAGVFSTTSVGVGDVTSEAAERPHRSPREPTGSRTSTAANCSRSRTRTRATARTVSSTPTPATPRRNGSSATTATAPIRWKRPTVARSPKSTKRVRRTAPT